MDTPAGNRLYRNLLDDKQDQFLFFGLFLLGMTGILALKELGYSQLTVTLFPVSLMMLYGSISWATKRYRIREDRVGDNIYYLGFLYTLVSLAYALYAYKTDGSGVEIILTNFGVAIFTTIIGLAGRVFFNQMREDPIEYEREARYALAEASGALRSQLADISTDMSSFKRKLVQIMEEGVVDISNSAKTSMAETVQTVSATTDEVLKSIHAAFQAFTDHSTNLNEAASKNVKALQSLFKRIEQIEASPDLIATKFEPIIQKFDEVASDALKRNRAQASDLKRLREVIDAAVASAETLHKTSAGLDASMSQKIEKFVQCSDSAVGEITRLTEKLRDTASALLDEIAVVQSVSTELKDGVTLHQSSISQIRSTFEDNLRIAQQHREAMSQLAADSRESLQALQGALVSLSKTLVEQLNGR